MKDERPGEECYARKLRHKAEMIHGQHLKMYRGWILEQLKNYCLEQAAGWFFH